MTEDMDHDNRMKLSEYVKKGNPMLSNYTTAWICQIIQINEKQLRQMKLRDIYQIPMAGDVARREVNRWQRSKLL